MRIIYKRSLLKSDQLRKHQQFKSDNPVDVKVTSKQTEATSGIPTGKT